MHYTFDEWKAKGYRIKKGAKASKIDGVCKFSEYQVYRDLIPGVDYNPKSARHQRGDGNPDNYEGEFDHYEQFEAIWGSD